MLAAFQLAIAAIVLLTVGAGLLRVVWGPSRADRMLAAQLLGTGIVAVLLLLGSALDQPAITDVALAFALLATVAAVAFVRIIWPAAAEQGPDT